MADYTPRFDPSVYGPTNNEIIERAHREAGMPMLKIGAPWVVMTAVGGWEPVWPNEHVARLCSALLKRIDKPASADPLDNLDAG